VGRAGSDAPAEPVTLSFAPVHPVRARPVWLAAAAVMLVVVALASVIALRRDGRDDPVTNSMPVLQSTAPATTTKTTPPTTPTTATAPTTAKAPGPVEQDYGAIAPGQGIAAIRIPKIGLITYVVAGSGRPQQSIAVGHVSTTPVPGQLGNSVLVGDRTSHVAPFEDLQDLVAGDQVEIETILGGTYVYRVDRSEVVNPEDYSVVTTSPTAKATLTLITCTPKFTSKQRLVVHASLVADLSSPVGRRQINYGQAGAAPAPDSVACNMTPPSG